MWRMAPKAAVVCAGTWSANGAAYDEIIKQDCAYVRGHYVPLAALYGVAANRDPDGQPTFFGTTDGNAPNEPPDTVPSRTPCSRR